MPMYNRGDFDRLITIKSVTETISGGYGDVIKTEATLTTRWAKKVYGTGGTEDIHADRESPIMQVTWIFDYVSALSEEMIITDRDGQDYKIINIQDIERQRYQKAICEQNR